MLRSLMLGVVIGSLAAANVRSEEEGYVKLFTEDGPPKGWVVREWNNLGKAPQGDVAWNVKEGVLSPGTTRGTWLVSEKEYGDFVLELEIKLSGLGNSGIALRAPLDDDPAFVGMELQIVEKEYNASAKDNELSGAIYRALAPKKQVYRSHEWNKVRIELKGSHLTAHLNGELIHDVDLATLDKPTRRHDGSEAAPVKDRPRRGHIGFQHLSRRNEPIEIRNVRVKEIVEGRK